MAGEGHNHIVGDSRFSEATYSEYFDHILISEPALLFSRLSEVGGDPAASLFAVPEASFSRSSGHARVTWYSDRSGVARPLDALPLEERDAAGAKLRSYLSDLYGKSDAETRDLLAAALNLYSKDSIVVVDGEPVLTEWGVVPAQAAGHNLAAHVANTIGPFLPPGCTPRLNVRGTDADVTPPSLASGATNSPAASVTSTDHGASKIEGLPANLPAAENDSEVKSASSALNALPPATRVHHTGQVHPSESPSPIWQRSGRPWLVFTLILVLLLAYMLWPGNLVYPERDSVRLSDASALEFQRQHNLAVEQEIRRLQNTLAGDACLIDASRRDDVLAPQSTTQPRAATAVPPVTSSPPSSGEPLPATPSQQAIGNGFAPRLASGELLRNLDNGTVFVVGASERGLSTGSGLFVTKRHVLTNLHVVEDVTRDRIVVSNKALTQPLRAKVVASTATSTIGGSDFALLELEQDVEIAVLPLSEQLDRLDQVVAAGFPAFILQSDPSFLASFREGDFGRLTAVQMAVTEGVVTQTQPGAGGVMIVGHTATISSGNSGGPLVDKCGRVVAINTFVRTDTENALRLNLALSTRDAIGFLQGHNIPVTQATDQCTDASAVPGGAHNAPAELQSPSDARSSDDAALLPPSPATEIDATEAAQTPLTDPVEHGRNADADLIRTQE